MVPMSVVVGTTSFGIHNRKRVFARQQRMKSVKKQKYTGKRLVKRVWNQLKSQC